MEGKRKPNPQMHSSGAVGRFVLCGATVHSSEPTFQGISILPHSYMVESTLAQRPSHIGPHTILHLHRFRTARTRYHESSRPRCLRNFHSMRTVRNHISLRASLPCKCGAFKIVQLTTTFLFIALRTGNNAGSSHVAISRSWGPFRVPFSCRQGPLRPEQCNLPRDAAIELFRCDAFCIRSCVSPAASTRDINHTYRYVLGSFSRRMLTPHLTSYTPLHFQPISQPA